MQEVRRALRVRGGAEDRALVVFQRQALCFVRGSGAIMPATTVAALAIARAAAEVPRHDFHCEDDSKKECGGPRINDPKASPSEGRGCGLAKT